MADEQTPQSDLIDDAIRQAERQLEQKLEALRLSAMSDSITTTRPERGEAAVLRPTPAAAMVADAPETDPGQPAPASPGGSWHEAPGGGDVSFIPAPTPYEPDAETSVELAGNPDEHDETSGTEASPQTLNARDLVAVWEPEPRETASFDAIDINLAEPAGTDEQSTIEREILHAPQAGWAGAGAAAEPATPAASAWAEPAQPRSMYREPAPTHSAGPSSEELQFWAYTRTALRSLQQASEGMSTAVTGEITHGIERTMREELAPTGATLKLVQQQLQQGLPRVAERVEQAIEHAALGTASTIHQLRDDLPTQLEHASQETVSGVREALGETSSSLHEAVQADVSRLEESIANNVTRMAQGTTDSVARVERDLELIGEGVARFERTIGAEFNRVESQLRASIEQAEASIGEQLAEPTKTIQRLDQAIPSKLDAVERSIGEQVKVAQRDVSNVLVNLVDANRASLDRVASIASTMDEDRSRRAEDVAVIIDAITSGWEGLAGAMKAMFEQHEQTAHRIAGIEGRLGELRDLEGAVEGSMTTLCNLVADLKPAPVIVTVAHAEAEVHNTSRSGWSPDGTPSPE